MKNIRANLYCAIFGHNLCGLDFDVTQNEIDFYSEFVHFIQPDMTLRKYICLRCRTPVYVDEFDITKAASEWLGLRHEPNIETEGVDDE